MAAGSQGLVGDLNDATLTAETEAGNAIHQMGSNAVPALVRMLLAPDDSGLKLTAIEILRKRTRFGYRFRTNYERRVRALQACQLLGPLANGAIPALRELANRPETSFRAAAVLVEIGPDGLQAVCDSLTNEDYGMRLDLIRVLGAQRGRIGSWLFRHSGKAFRIRAASSESLRQTL